jgi:tetratricopeptide (TPR) repeat protein
VRFRIECINDFKLTDLTLNKEIVLRSHSRLLAALVFAGGEYVSRESLISLIWPDEPDSVAKNRLRVALVRFRALLGSAVVESSGYIALSREQVTCDIWEIEDLLQSADDAVSVDGELALLVSSLRSIEVNDLAEWGSLSEKLITRLLGACRRGIVLAEELGDQNARLICSLAGLSFSADNAHFCTNALESAIQLREGVAILTRIRSFVSPTVLALPQVAGIVNRIRSGELPVEVLNGAKSQFLVQVFGVAIKSRPELCRAVLASPETLPLSGEHPREMLSLLEQVIFDPNEKDENWERCVARATGLRAWLNDSPGVLELGYPLIEHSKNPIILRATWNAVSIAHSLLRDWEMATEALEKTLEFARQTGDEIDVLSTRGNGASYLMHQMKFEEAEQEYRASLNALLEKGTPRALFDHAVGLGNSAFIPVFQGDFETAVVQLETAIRVRSESSMPVQLGLLQAALGYVKMSLGETDQVFMLIRHGFIDAFRSLSDRNVQITFEYAAGALACTDESEFAHAVIDWVDRWRIRTQMPRSLAERAFCKRLFDDEHKMSDMQLSDDQEPRQVGQVLMKKLRMQI